MDAQIKHNREKFEELREQWRAAHPRLYEKLKAAVEAETYAKAFHRIHQDQN